MSRIRARTHGRQYAVHVGNGGVAPRPAVRVQITWIGEQFGIAFADAVAGHADLVEFTVGAGEQPAKFAFDACRPPDRVETEPSVRVKFSAKSSGERFSAASIVSPARAVTTSSRRPGGSRSASIAARWRSASSGSIIAASSSATPAASCAGDCAFAGNALAVNPAANPASNVRRSYRPFGQPDAVVQPGDLNCVAGQGDARGDGGGIGSRRQCQRDDGGFGQQIDRRGKRGDRSGLRAP